MESLRQELDAKEQEIDALREAVASPTRTDAPGSLNDEMLGSLRQQHALDLSNAQSAIRSLENTVFEREAAIHSLQKQITALQDQASRLPRQAPPRSFSPGMPSRPSSRVSNDARRPPSGLSRPDSNVPPPLSRTVFDQALSAETLHKRKVSLSMLKARIESELSVAGGVSPHPHSRALSPVHSLSGKEEETHHHNGSVHSHSHSHPQHHHSHSHLVVHRPQFLDESHVFWCNSCTGDLVIL
jgi:myosin protein heavy chain